MNWTEDQLQMFFVGVFIGGYITLMILIIKF